jgi:hypothetical protein
MPHARKRLIARRSRATAATRVARCATDAIGNALDRSRAERLDACTDPGVTGVGARPRVYAETGGKTASDGSKIRRSYLWNQRVRAEVWRKVWRSRTRTPERLSAGARAQLARAWPRASGCPCVLACETGGLRLITGPIHERAAAFPPLRLAERYLRCPKTRLLTTKL